jgi:hypothetical protein
VPISVIHFSLLETFLTVVERFQNTHAIKVHSSIELSHGRGIDVCARGKQHFHNRGKAILYRYTQIGDGVAVGPV